MNITLIGTGNVATVLGKSFIQKGHHILQIIGRREDAAKELTDTLKCPHSLSFKEVNQQSDLYIIAVSDNAVEQIIDEIIIPPKSIIVHTAGGVSINVFKNRFKNFGVLYPLQSLRKENKELPEIPFFVDANNETAKIALYNFAKTISEKVSYATDEQRLKLHVAAVLTSNFPNFLYALTNDFCTKENIDFKNLLPLMQETINRLQRFNPAEMQTGPAIRKDMSTIEKHLDVLEGYPETKNIYRFLSDEIFAYFFKK
ncbi:hypothetical protein A9P82_08260 [Arachidicoccus ginsenosidimutans]|uniref:Rossmann-like and DUF2520 domain-containing protein n=1 Tax=Arachidicoccus sp. BS20 TaxID=1850526 RepID=UPI0007F0547D|nr:DUF2520 domain-containing protein [Arachidicoccus sp. BS20]ANI89283.1 hypothetical protein A9P82_08260 [Arachidicoccus sp. BS20]